MKKQELAEVLNNVVEICSEVIEITEKTTSIAKKAILIIGAVRMIFAIPENPEDAIADKEEAPAPTPKKAKEKKEEPPAEPSISKEDVRKCLVGLSNSGHREDVKALLQKYGADNLSKLDACHYDEIVADAEAIKNAG